MLAGDASRGRGGVVLTLLGAAALALAVVLSAMPSAKAQEASACESRPKNALPGSTTVPHPTPEGTLEDANSCSINEEAPYTAPVADGP